MNRAGIGFVFGLVFGLAIGLTIAPAQADTTSEIVEIRRALQSIAHSLEGCRK